MKHIARLPHFAGVILACGCLIGVLGFVSTADGVSRVASLTSKLILVTH